MLTSDKTVAAGPAGSGPIEVEEKFFTLKAAAQALGLPYFKLARAVKAGLIPHYTICNSRRLVRVSEVVAVIESSREGGSR